MHMITDGENLVEMFTRTEWVKTPDIYFHSSADQTSEIIFPKSKLRGPQGRLCPCPSGALGENTPLLLPDSDGSRQALIGGHSAPGLVSTFCVCPFLCMCLVYLHLSLIMRTWVCYSSVNQREIRKPKYL